MHTTTRKIVATVAIAIAAPLATTGTAAAGIGTSPSNLAQSIGTSPGITLPGGPSGESTRDGHKTEIEVLS